MSKIRTFLFIFIYLFFCVLYPRPLCYRTHTRTHAHTHASTHTRTHVPTLPRCFHLHVPSSSQLPRVPKRTNASKHPLPKSHPLLFFLTCVVFVSPQPKLSKNVVYKFLPSPHVPTHQVRKQQKIPTQHEKHAMICPSVEEARIWENLLKEAVSSSNDRSDPKKKAPTCLPAPTGCIIDDGDQGSFAPVWRDSDLAAISVESPWSLNWVTVHLRDFAGQVVPSCIVYYDTHKWFVCLHWRTDRG